MGAYAIPVRRMLGEVSYSLIDLQVDKMQFPRLGDFEYATAEVTISRPDLSHDATFREVCEQNVSIG